MFFTDESKKTVSLSVMKKFFFLTLSMLLLAAPVVEARKSMKVMSYNIRLGIADDGDNSWMYRRPATIAMLEKEAPDVFGLQEAFKFQQDFITENLPQYKAVGVGRDDGIDKGVELASADWIIFHDPDNEAVNDGYAKLLTEALKADVDIAVGSTLMIGESRMVFNYYRNWIGKGESVKVVRGGRDLLNRISFVPANIQTMTIRKDFVKSHGLHQVVGGAGQDSLFCQQMFAEAGAIAFTPATVQIYFAEREFSIVNSVGPKFYAKYALTERARVDWLKSSGLVDDYMSRRFVTYIVGWYFKKLASLDREKSEDATRALFKLLRIYADVYDWRDYAIDKFLVSCAAGAWAEAWAAVADEVARIEKRRKKRGNS